MPGMKTLLQIQECMTAGLVTITEDIPVADAIELLRTHGIRHLPVVRGDEVVGVVSDRDLKLAAMFRGSGVLQVGDVMTADPFIVHPGAAVERVVDIMAERKYGCAIVKAPGGGVLGIFTDRDALRLLSAVLRNNRALS